MVLNVTSTVVDTLPKPMCYYTRPDTKSIAPNAATARQTRAVEAVVDEVARRG